MNLVTSIVITIDPHAKQIRVLQNGEETSFAFDKPNLKMWIGHAVLSTIAKYLEVKNEIPV